MTTGLEHLKEVQSSRIPLMHTPLLGTTDQDSKNLRSGRYPGITREFARITGWYSERVFAVDAHRTLARDIASYTGCRVSLQLDPWKVGKRAYITPFDENATDERISRIIAHVNLWKDFLGCPDAIKICDESVEIDDNNDEQILARTYQLWRATRPCKVFIYNARMVREDGLFPFVHPLAPGPSACSMYDSDLQVNAARLADTCSLASRLGLATVAHVELHRQREPNGGGRYEPIGYDPTRFEALGMAIRLAGSSLAGVSLDEVPIAKDRHVNKNVAGNLKALIRGLG